MMFFYRWSVIIHTSILHHCRRGT